MTIKQKTIGVRDDSVDSVVCMHTNVVITHFTILSYAVTYIIIYFMCIILLRDRVSG